ncbi:triacylglycerol lipase V precursor [Apiospora kogelbergensis]|uniref:triacylglycerol lipase V precursor n=1 Tax=Apiospora kogelbergensis TaxID=1337665 RepID=UPI003130A8C9
MPSFTSVFSITLLPVLTATYNLFHVKEVRYRYISTIARLALVVLAVGFFAFGESRKSETDLIYPSLTKVKTTSGLLIGHPGPNRSDVVEFLGVPYAEAPIGELRFAPPLPYRSSDGIVNANEWTPSKPVDYPGFTPQAQRILNFFTGSAGNAQSEDCLTLNIWTKLAGAATQQKPVLIFLHGGRFANGNTHTPFFDGQALADAEEVIVVTLNYRLNIFGFPGAPDAPGNLGLRDQRLAVEWIRDNIAGFGGDPARMVLLGQSSGGVAADYWAYAHQQDPIVSGLISHSGNALSFPLNEPSRQVSNWHNVSEALGCGADKKSLECMRAKDWTEILQAASKVPPAASDNPARSTPAFYPQVDEELVFSDYPKRSKEGSFARIPYVLGNNANEQGYYVIPAYGRGINVTQAQGDDFLRTSFTCPNHAQALSRRAAGVPVWQYRYFGDWDNTRLYPTSGAYHGVDMHMVFGNAGPVSGLPPAAPQEADVALVQRLWARFAADPADGLTGAGWPRFEPGADSLARFAYGDSPEWSFVDPEVFAGSC